MSAALSFENVSLHYGERQILKAITTQFPAGTLTAIVGPNGAGKTSLLRAALGLVPAQGAIRILDRAREDWSRESLARAIAYLPQNSEAHWPITAENLVALGRMPHRKFLAPPDAGDRAVAQALQRCEAESFAQRRIDTLSAGEKARVLLARALATEAPILIADEPAAHLDPAHQLALMDLLKQEARRGTAVLVTLHDLSLAVRHCDRIAVMDRGILATHGPAQSALTDAILAETFGIRPLRPDEAAGEPLLAWTRL